MREVISTRNGYIEHVGRRQGNSTRQIDYAIQKLFDGDTVKVECHASKSMRAKDLLMKRISIRLLREHRIDKNSLDIDTSKMTMKLIFNP